MALQLISSQNPRVSTNDERKQHPVWPRDLIQTELSRSAFRVTCFIKALCFQSSTHTVSSPSQAAPPVALSLTTWSRDSCLKSSGASILSVSFFLLDLINFLSDLISHFCLPHTEQFQLPRFLLTLKIVQAFYMSQREFNCVCLPSSEMQVLLHTLLSGSAQ